MHINEEDYLQLSGIQHYAFCPRQWGLIYLEDQWADNWRTIDGINKHERAHNDKIVDKREDGVVLRALKIVSHTLGVSGECDVVEFLRDENGVELNKYAGRYRPFPVEYKRGKAKYTEADALQLCAEAVCLEEMLLIDIPRGALFYGEAHRRFEVEFTAELRNKLKNIVAEMFRTLNGGKIPEPNMGDFCKACSLNNECIPGIAKKPAVINYIKQHVNEDDDI